MSEEKHYLDEQWDDVPLPDSDIAWQKMEALLDKEKKRRIVPFWHWRYVLPALLLGSAAIGGYVWLGGEKESISADHTAQQKAESPVVERTPLPANTEKGFTPPPATPVDDETTSADPAPPNATSRQDVPVTTTSPITPNKGQPASTKSLTTNTTNSTNTTTFSKKQESKQREAKEKANKDISKASSSKGPLYGRENPAHTETATPNTTPPVTTITTNTNNTTNTTNPPKRDSVLGKDTLSVKAAEPMAIAETEKKKKPAEENSEYAFSAGVGLQQSIAFSGQQSSSYNYKGKKSSLSDRIPSFYVRYQRDKLFIQAEFQYAVPQPVEQFSFSQKTRYDVASLNVNTERFTLQKLYYHQLPLSFNYYVLPDLSVGIGTMYSILAGAVTEQEVSSKNVQTGIEAISKNMIPVQGFRDSFLYKSVAGYLVQADYHWKRFSLGLRYTQNLQPFISYTDQAGMIRDEKTKLLQAIIRFRLFQK